MRGGWVGAVDQYEEPRVSTQDLISKLQDTEFRLQWQRDQIDKELALIPRLIQILSDRNQLQEAERAMGEACSLPYVSAVGCER